ncbi:MAG: hypothetical protein OXF08_09125 [Bacteroidetes bacterium]|nr:hypothetical protein [Bacteroidota bacterium]
MKQKAHDSRVTQHIASQRERYSRITWYHYADSSRDISFASAQFADMSYDENHLTVLIEY